MTEWGIWFQIKHERQERARIEAELAAKSESTMRNLPPRHETMGRGRSRREDEHVTLDTFNRAFGG
jgi:hypothetical protein